jgi:hypothetical protein
MRIARMMKDNMKKNSKKRMEVEELRKKVEVQVKRKMTLSLGKILQKERTLRREREQQERDNQSNTDLDKSARQLLEDDTLNRI